MEVKTTGFGRKNRPVFRAVAVSAKHGVGLKAYIRFNHLDAIEEGRQPRLSFSTEGYEVLGNRHKHGFCDSCHRCGDDGFESGEVFRRSIRREQEIPAAGIKRNGGSLQDIGIDALDCEEFTVPRADERAVNLHVFSFGRYGGRVLS
jgi:hypothetical protein